MNPTNVETSELSYGDFNYSVPDSLIRSINRFKTEHSASLDRFTATFGPREVTGTEVRLAYTWSSGSIQTTAEVIDEATKGLSASNYGDVKDFIQSTADAEVKWDHVHEVWNSELPDRVANLANLGRWVEAQAVLSGLKRDGERETTYCRPVKANMVTRLLGDPHAVCLDSRRREVLRTLMEDMFLPGGQRRYAGPDHDHRSDPLGTYRNRAAAGNMKPVDPWSKKFLEERLVSSPGEMRVITSEILDALEAETRAERCEVEHILFNLGGPTTFHESLQALMKEHRR